MILRNLLSNFNLFSNESKKFDNNLGLNKLSQNRRRLDFNETDSHATFSSKNKFVPSLSSLRV